MKKIKGKLRWNPVEFIIPSLFIVFSLFSNPIYSQVVNDSCHTAMELVINSYGDFSCVDGSTISATPDEFPNHPCSISGFPTVWYKVGLEYDATHLNLHVSNEEEFTTVIRVFQEVDGCDVLYPLEIGPDEQTCLSGINGQVKLVGFEINGYSTYYIAVSTLNLNGADFELCVNSTAQEISCVREKEIFFYNMSSQTRPRGPFYPGDEVLVCMTVPLFNSANNGCQWFQGLVPVFGAGWDAGSFDINSQPLNPTLNGDYIGAPGNGVYANTTWDWFTDVGYHSSHPFYQIGDIDYNGTVDMCSSLFDPYCPYLGGIFGGCCGPCWDNQGDELPPGWFAYGINGSCSVPGPPVGVDWGDGNTCSGIMGPWEFCFQLQVEEYPGCSLYGNSLDLTLGFYTFSDGEIGAWNGGSSACVYDPPLQLRLPALCFQDVEQVEPIDIIVCGSDTVILPLLEYTDRDHLINYWYYENESIHTLNDASYLKPTDTLNFKVFTESNKYITKKYLTVYGHRGEQTVCEVLYFRILIYPEIDASFEFEANGLGVQFNSIIDVDSIYAWSFGDDSESDKEDPFHMYQEEGIYNVELILTTPCGIDTSYQELNLITSRPFVSFTYSPQHICVGDSVIFVSDIIGQTDSIQWNFEGGMPNLIDADTAVIYYGIAGLFDVMLAATNIIGSDTLLLSDAIHVDSVPVLKYHVEVYDSLLVFSYTGSEVDSVFWDLGDGLIAHGITATKIYEGAGEYPVILYVKGVCGLDSIPFSVKIQTTSISTSNFGTGFSLYPNPASGEVHIKRQEDIGETTVQVYNIVGQQVTTMRWPPEHLIITIDLRRPGFNPGTFYIMVKTGEGCFMAPLIVQ